ncbi:MAG: primosomal protein N' [Bacilli bacterium]|nr:primosomal protein N' [Bacilli bacterium]
MTAEVLVEIKAQGMDKTFTYAIPENLKDKVKIGIRVLVPFGNQKLEGFVMSIDDDKKFDYELKEIIEAIDDEAVLNDEMILLGKYMAHKTLSNLISCFSTMLPKALKASHKTNVNKKYITYLKLNKEKLDMVSTDKQKEVIKLFNDDLVLKSAAVKISSSSVNTLIKNKVLEEIKEEVYRYNLKSNYEDKTVSLTEEQNNAYNTIKNSLNTFNPFLIHGVTGSGKTEVYMHLISEVLNSGKEAIVLVPEISLTPQLVNIFKARFGDIAVLHSRLSDGERYDEWRRILEGKVKIVVGARSAIFAPLKNIGIIIVDEEHTDTYKQENNPRYNAIDIGVYRAKYHKCPIVLGSATPSIESYTRAILGTYTLINMPTRVNNNLPKVHLIDMKDEIKKGNRIFSELLKNKLNEVIKNNKQAIILLNRRGFSTVITCHNCGYTSKCPNCDIPLTYHKTSNTMRCHYCGYGTGKITICPECKSKDIDSFGMGTQKLEEEIMSEFSGAKVIRMDIDTTTKKGAHEKIIESFRNGEYNILLGTQMISKGLDFPNVTLVGVINGDASLNIPDFRSAERTFGLLNQVSGRAGRSKDLGEVIIQGFNVNHYSIVKAKNCDYKGFYDEEISIRKKLGYPPFNNLCLLKISSKDYDIVSKESNKIANYLKENIKDNVLGPSTSTMPKINNIYYMQILIKYKKSDAIYECLKYIKEIYKNNHKVKVEIDINPLRI